MGYNLLGKILKTPPGVSEANEKKRGRGAVGMARGGGATQARRAKGHRQVAVKELRNINPRAD